MAFTSAPWAIFHNGVTNMIVPAMRHGVVAGIIPNEYDARLIAAAPDMHAALLWLKPYADLQVTKYPDSEDAPGWRMVLAAIERETVGGAPLKEIPYNPAWTHGEIGADEAALMEANGWRMRPDGSYFKPGS